MEPKNQLIEIFKNYDQDHDMLITMEQAVNLFKQLQLNITKRKLKKVYQLYQLFKFAGHSNKLLGFDTVNQFIDANKTQMLYLFYAKHSMRKWLKHVNKNAGQVQEENYQVSDWNNHFEINFGNQPKKTQIRAKFILGGLSNQILNQVKNKGIEEVNQNSTFSIFQLQAQDNNSSYKLLQGVEAFAQQFKAFAQQLQFSKFLQGLQIKAQKCENMVYLKIISKKDILNNFLSEIYTTFSEMSEENSDLKVQAYVGFETQFSEITQLKNSVLDLISRGFRFQIDIQGKGSSISRIRHKIKQSKILYKLKQQHEEQIFSFILSSLFLDQSKIILNFQKNDKILSSFENMQYINQLAQQISLPAILNYLVNQMDIIGLFEQFQIFKNLSEVLRKYAKTYAGIYFKSSAIGGKIQAHGCGLQKLLQLFIRQIQL